ncbi:MAG TPA: biosynthetic peptidoglycan transglycosylase, partial [Polyangia bacterium]|nr:biosynthetic peptidoglycan transglycosylase [Polyangia bacterium]
VNAPIPLSIRAEGRLPGTDARFTLAARLPGGDGPPVLELEVPDLPLGEIGSLLPADWPVAWDRASADGTLAVELLGGGAEIAIRGQVNVSGLGLAHERIAASPLADLAANTDFKIAWDRAANVVHLERLLISRGRAHFTLRGDVRTDRLAFDARLNLPPTACRHVLGAIPPELRSGPGEMQLEGTFGLDLTVAIDVDAPGETVLEAELDNRCRIGEWGDLPAPDQYRRPFTYQAYDEWGGRLRLVTGPGTDRWTPLGQISPYLVEASLTTEDGKFRGHAGLTVPELRRAIELNLQNRSLTHGASTITMQLAKNLFLSRERTIERKLQELFYVWYLESFFSKDEILELYFNIVEFGPSLYGIRDAATHYFGRDPHELNLAESVFLIKLLPSPVIRHAAYERGEVSERKMTSLQRVMRTMRARGRITEAELQAGLSQRIEFHQEGDPLPPPRIPPERDGFRLSPAGDFGDYEPEETEDATWESETP